jgi:hypothetical protein
MKAIHRYEVPVDDEWHTLDLTGEVLHVASRRRDVVEVWAIHDDQGDRLPRHFRIFGTGHPLPDGRLRHVGTAFADGGELVWHLMEGGLIPSVALDGTN